MSEWVLEQIKPETWLEAKGMKTELCDFGHIVRRQGSLEEAVMLGKWKAAGKEEENMRWIHSIKEAPDTSLQELSRAAENGTLRTSLLRSCLESELTQ